MEGRIATSINLLKVPFRRIIEDLERNQRSGKNARPSEKEQSKGNIIQSKFKGIG